MKLAYRTLVLVLLASGCKLLGIASEVKCTEFTGDAKSAHWSSCDDKVKREVACRSTFGVRNQVVAPSLAPELKCDCIEDGVIKTFFFGKDPPLAARDDATRVANANCRWKIAP